MSTICPECGNDYDALGTHWRHNEYPDIEHSRESLRGMALGDGSFDAGRGNSRLCIIMTNKTFLNWYREQLDWLATDVRVHRTPEQLATVGYGSESPDAYSTQYVLRTRNHPTISEWHDEFMTENEKQIPDNFSLSWEALKYWYISDGHYEMQENAVRPRIVIGATNYVGQERKVEQMFGKLGLKPSFSSEVIRLGVKNAERFFDNTEPVPGFAHKWP